jgi:hypothetical protein
MSQDYGIGFHGYDEEIHEQINFDKQDEVTLAPQHSVVSKTATLPRGG